MSSTISFISNSRVAGDVALKSDGTSGVKSDTLSLKNPCIGLMVTADGTVAVDSAPDKPTVSVPLVLKAGSIYPFGVRRIFSTGTTLNDNQIVLLYGP